MACSGDTLGLELRTEIATLSWKKSSVRYSHPLQRCWHPQLSPHAPRYTFECCQVMPPKKNWRKNQDCVKAREAAKRKREGANHSLSPLTHSFTLSSSPLSSLSAPNSLNSQLTQLSAHSAQLTLNSLTPHGSQLTHSLYKSFVIRLVILCVDFS